MRYACAFLALSLFVASSPAPASDLEPLWRADIGASPAASIVYADDGKTLLVSGLRGEVALWVAGDDKPRLRYPGATGVLNAARFADGGQTVVALDARDRKLWRWQAVTAAALPSIDLSPAVGAQEFPIRFDVDAKGLIGFVASQTALHLVPLNGRDPPRAIAAPEAKRPFGSAALAPDGGSACAIDAANRIHCYRTSNGQLITSLTYELDKQLQSIEISRDGALTVGTSQGYVARWKSGQGSYIDTAGPGEVASPANAVARLPSGTFVAAGRYDGRIFVFSPAQANRAPIVELLGAKGPVQMIAVNSAGHLAAAAGREIVVWDIGAELAKRGAKH